MPVSLRIFSLRKLIISFPENLGTPPRIPRISDLETNIFELDMMVKSGLVFFYFEILLAPSELLLPSAKKAARKG